jgi:hypothetical protein
LNGKRWEDEIAAPPMTAAEKMKRMAGWLAIYPWSTCGWLA